jgi:hypothetical protein
LFKKVDELCEVMLQKEPIPASKRRYRRGHNRPYFEVDLLEGDSIVTGETKLTLDFEHPELDRLLRIYDTLGFED